MTGQASFLSETKVVSLDNSQESPGFPSVVPKPPFDLAAKPKDFIIGRLHGTPAPCPRALVRPSRLMSTAGSGARDKNIAQRLTALHMWPGSWELRGQQLESNHSDIARKGPPQTSSTSSLKDSTSSQRFSTGQDREWTTGNGLSAHFTEKR